MKKKKDLLKESIVYKPFEYQEAADYWLKTTTSSLVAYRSTNDV